MLCRNASLTDVPSGVPEMTVTLDLSYNAISDLTNVKGMGQLTSLYVYKNIIETIDIEAFWSLRNLRSLFMGHNKLTYIHPDTFKHNTKLEELDLHGNNISLLDKGPFHHLINLRALNLADCNLSNISKETFQKTVKLIRLDISNNKLTYIEDHAFDYLNSLNILNLSRNLLMSVDFLLKISETNLQEISLYVSNNKLGNLTCDILTRMMYLKNLDFHDNPLSCRCFDRNLSLRVSRPCSEYSDPWKTYMDNCSYEIARVSVAEFIPMEARCTEISINEKITYEISKNLSGLNVISDDFEIVTGAPVLQESSETLSETEVIVIVSLSLTLVMLASVIGICFCPKISKCKLSVSSESEAVPEDGNYQQQRKCEVCQTYQNYTPNCNHRVSRENKMTSKQRKINFATQSELETYELILREGLRECCLYEPTRERVSMYYKNSNSESGQRSLMPSPDSRHEELETDITANRTHPSCTLENHEDTVSECMAHTSGRGNLILASARHSYNRAIYYVACRSDNIDVSGGQRYPRLAKLFSLQTTPCSPTLGPPRVPKRVQSLLDRRRRSPLTSSKRRTTCDGVTPEIQSSSTSLEPNTDHVYYEIN
jgi:hypothetical protein